MEAARAKAASPALVVTTEVGVTGAEEREEAAFGVHEEGACTCADAGAGAGEVATVVGLDGLYAGRGTMGAGLVGAAGTTTSAMPSVH